MVWKQKAITYKPTTGHYEKVDSLPPGYGWSLQLAVSRTADPWLASHCLPYLPPGWLRRRISRNWGGKHGMFGQTSQASLVLSSGISLGLEGRLDLLMCSTGGHCPISHCQGLLKKWLWIGLISFFLLPYTLCLCLFLLLNFYSLSLFAHFNFFLVLLCFTFHNETLTN